MILGLPGEYQVILGLSGAPVIFFLHMFCLCAFSRDTAKLFTSSLPPTHYILTSPMSHSIYLQFWHESSTLAYRWVVRMSPQLLNLPCSLINPPLLFQFFIFHLQRHNKRTPRLHTAARPYDVCLYFLLGLTELSFQLLLLILLKLILLGCTVATASDSSLLLQMGVAWSVCLSVYLCVLVTLWALQTRLTRLKCHLGSVGGGWLGCCCIWGQIIHSSPAT